MKTKMLLTGMLMTATSGLAQAAPPTDVCKAVANLAAQTAGLTFTDGTWGSKYDPGSVTLKQDTKTYPIASVTDLGSCDDNNSTLNPAWCQVAGGAPEVYQMAVAHVDTSGASSPFATVTVTYNRGGCWVDEVDLEAQY